MPRLQPLRVGILIKVFEADGWVRSRPQGSHLSMTEPGHKRPVVILTSRKEAEVWLIRTNLRTARMSRDRYFELLEQVR